MAVVHCRVCGRSYPAKDSEATEIRCECGKIIPPEELLLAAARLRKKSLTSPWHALDWYRATKWVLGGIFCIALGIWLITGPEFRTNPKVLTVSDAMPGVGAIVVGCAMLALMVIGTYRR